MFLKPLMMLIFLINIQQTFAEDLFKIAPYTLMIKNGQLLLNMQLNADKKLTIEDDENSSSKDFKKNQLYQIELKDLVCGTSKEIRIKDSLSNAVVFSKSLVQPACATTPSEEDYTFGFISDTQQFSDRHAAISKVIAYHHSLTPMQFLINGGDIVQEGNDESQWFEYFKGGIAYLMDIPQIAAVGNHDYRGNEVKYQLPKFFKKYMRWNGAMDNGNLFFEMPGFQLVIWNSNTPELSNDQQDEMWRWLEAKMLKAQKDKIPLIVATHYPVYASSTNRFTSSCVKALKKHLVPLAEAYGVKLILSGHTHMYERSYRDGVNYLVAGPAGGRSNKPTFKNPYMKYLNANALTFTKIHYKDKSFKIESYDQDNVLIDQLTIKL